MSDKRVVVGVMAAMALLVFLLDAPFPRGQTSAPLYVAVVAAGLWLHGGRAVIVAAAAGTVLTVVGHFVSGEGPADVDIMNRAVSVVAIWLVAGLCLAYKQAQTATRRLATIVESSGDAIVSKTLEGQVLTWNAGAERLYGYTAAEMLGRPAAVVIPPDKHEEERAIIEQLSRGERVEQYDTCRLTKDGREVAVSLVASPLLDATGAVTGVATIARDITQRRELEDALRSAKDAAEAANRAKSQFLANMSHEIRTPMNGIFGMLDLALDTELEPGQKHFLESARTSAELLLRVINDILDFSRVEAGRLELDPHAFSLREMVAGAVQAFGPRAHAKGLELALRVRPDVPDELSADGFRIAQVLTNLVGNAVKFTERGEVVVDVSVEAAAGPELTLHFAVSDTGPGVPADKQRLIFDAFSQVDGSMARRFGGTGLGLAISAGLVELMRGRIWIESDVGKGSTFHFTVVCERVAGTEATQKAGRLDLEGLPVLVADDNAANRSIIAEMLCNWRMTPTVVPDGRAALAALHRASGADDAFPLVLLDGHMPDLDGFEVARRIRQNPKLAGATILMLSSAESGDEARLCRELHVAAYLRKPISQSQLLDAMLTALGKLGDDAAGAAPPEAASAARALRILVAEDNEVNQEFATSLLRKHGHTVTIAADGKEAVKAWERGGFDLVLMDVQMPGLDGFAATAAIREKEKGTRAHTPIVAVTAHALKGDRERCLEAGMDAYVSKPIRASALLQVIAELVPGGGPPAAAAASGVKQAARGFDLDLALEHVDGDREVLRHMARVYLKQSERLRAEIGAAVERGDAQALASAVHRLKGSMSIFGARAACDAAHALEASAEAGRLGETRRLHAALEREAEALEPEIAALLGGASA